MVTDKKGLRRESDRDFTNSSSLKGNFNTKIATKTSIKLLREVIFAPLHN